MKPFLVLQVRPETDIADQEYAGICTKCELAESRFHRIRVDQEGLGTKLDLNGFAGVIVGGGPACVSDDSKTRDPLEKQVEQELQSVLPDIIVQDIAFMGCCYGLSLLVSALGGTVDQSRYAEQVGAADCFLTAAGKADKLTRALTPNFQAFVGHKEAVQVLPKECSLLVSSKACPVQMVRFGKNIYATQFHPEADAHDIEARIRIYRNHGYFPPEEADELITQCHSSSVTQPRLILRNFAHAYG